MCLCDELLTIVVLGLVNLFVHGRVPTTVPRWHIEKCDWTICSQVGFIHEWEGGIEISVPRINVWPHEVYCVMTNDD